jgi:replication factor A2
MQKDFKEESLKAVTIKQLLEAKDLGNGENFDIDGHPLTSFTFVGQVLNITIQETRIRITVDDGTGQIEASKFTSEAMSEDADSLPKQNQYIRIHGKLRTIGNKKNVSANFVRPLTDMNELSAHYLEATLVHLYCTKGPLNSIGGGNANSNGDGGHAAGGELSNIPGITKAAAQKLTMVGKVAQQVYRHIMSSPQSTEGLNMQDISRDLRIDLNQVRKAGDDLMSQALIYITLDEDTWALLPEME